MLSYIRKGKKQEEFLVVVVNFANVEQVFSVGVSQEGKYKEITRKSVVSAFFFVILQRIVS